SNRTRKIDQHVARCGLVIGAESLKGSVVNSRHGEVTGAVESLRRHIVVVPSRRLIAAAFCAEFQSVLAERPTQVVTGWPERAARAARRAEPRSPVHEAVGPDKRRHRLEWNAVVLRKKFE